MLLSFVGDNIIQNRYTVLVIWSCSICSHICVLVSFIFHCASGQCSLCALWFTLSYYHQIARNVIKLYYNIHNNNKCTNILRLCPRFFVCVCVVIIDHVLLIIDSDSASAFFVRIGNNDAMKCRDVGVPMRSVVAFMIPVN